VLERQAGGVLPAAPRREGGRTINEGNRAALAAEDAARAEREAKERVALWAAEERARIATEQGRVDPAWRQIERDLVQGFKPPPATLHDAPEGGAARQLGDRLGSAARQLLGVLRRGEEGLRRPRVPGRVVEAALGRPVDPSQQNYLGDPEGIGVRAMPMEQQQAALEAWSDPVSWYAVEVEVETDAQGQVTQARVAVPSGRRAFDRFALEEVRRRVAAAGKGLGASVSRWRCEAAYAVSASPSIGLSFDDAMLFSKKARQDFATRYPLKQEVRTKVTLRWVRPPL
jgi:TonB family protein